MPKKEKINSSTKGEEEIKSAPKPAKTLNEEVRFTQKVIKSGLRNVASHHIESFNYALDKCLPKICKYMLPVEISSQVHKERMAQAQDKGKPSEAQQV